MIQKLKQDKQLIDKFNIPPVSEKLANVDLPLYMNHSNLVNGPVPEPEIIKQITKMGQAECERIINKPILDVSQILKKYNYQINPALISRIEQMQDNDNDPLFGNLDV